MPDDAPDGPVFEDGNIQTTRSEPMPAARTVQEDSADRAEPQQWKDDKRSDIFNRARERRQAETETFSGDPNDPDALYGSNVDQSDLGELEQEALRRRQEQFAPANSQQPQRKTLNNIDPNLLATTLPLIVDGQQQEVSIEDLLREHQINRAADKRLEQARAILQHSHEIQGGQSQPDNRNGYDEANGQDDFAREPDEFEGIGTTSRRPANALELAEKIQLGTPDEAAQAIEDFITSAVANREPPVDETTRVLTALEDANSKQAVVKFAQENPMIANSTMLQEATTKEIQRHMALDLMNAGYSVEQLREIAPSAQHLTNLHKQARVQRLNGVRQVSELMTAGYHDALGEIRKLVSQPQQQSQNPATGMQARQARKDGLQPQPAARRLSPSLGAPSQTRTQEQSRSQAVANIRKSRGQSS